MELGCWLLRDDPPVGLVSMPDVLAASPEAAAAPGAAWGGGELRGRDWRQG